MGKTSGKSRKVKGTHEEIIKGEYQVNAYIRKYYTKQRNALVNVVLFCCEKIVICDLIFLNISRNDERLYPSGSVRLSNNKLSFSPENTKLVKNILVLEC